jgi:two-component system osmolarity sensor histidine kinase EnvZ
MRHPFTRLEKARSNAKGAGLGLAIVERVMRAHGGRLDLLAREGGGLRAILRLPGGGNASVRARMQSAHPGGQ